MKLMIFIICAVTIIVAFSCSSSTNDLSSKESSFSISTDTLIIKISAKEQPYYYSVDGYIDEKTKHPIFIGYNHQLHSFDHYDLIEKRLVKKIEMEERGPNGVPLNGAFKFLTHDTVIYRVQDWFLKIDGDGRVLQRTNLFDYIEDSDYLFRRGGITLASPSNNITFKNNKLISFILHRDFFYWDDSFYEKNFLASINVKDGEISYLNSIYPSEASSRQQYGQLIKPFTLLVDSFLVYNFPFSSQVFRLNLRNNKVEKFDIQSKYSNNLSKTLNTNVSQSTPTRDRLRIESEHFRSATFFKKIVYDPYKDVYYRIHIEPDKKDEDLINNYYLCVFDAEFNKIGETELDNQLYIENYFLTKEGLIIQIANNDNIRDINKLKLCRIKIHL